MLVRTQSASAEGENSMGQSIVAKEFTTVTDDSSAVLGPPASFRIDREMPQKLRDSDSSS